MDCRSKAGHNHLPCNQLEPRTNVKGHRRREAVSGCTILLRPAQPVIRFTMTVGYGDDIHSIIRDRIDQLVQKSPQEDLADSRPNLFANLRKSLKDRNGRPHCTSELLAEPLFLGLVVLEGIFYSLLARGSKIRAMVACQAPSRPECPGCYPPCMQPTASQLRRTRSRRWPYPAVQGCHR